MRNDDVDCFKRKKIKGLGVGCAALDIRRPRFSLRFSAIMPLYYTRTMRILCLFLGLMISLVLTGCGDSKHKIEERARFQSFTNNLQNSVIEYEVSFSYTAPILQQAVQAAQLPVVQRRLERDPSYDAMGDFLQNYAHFDDSMTSGQNAVDLVAKAEPDFQHIYTTYRDLPPSFKDDFYNIKDLMDKNIVFIQTLKQGEVQKDALQDWMDGNTKIQNSCKSILLEIDRLQK